MTNKCLHSYIPILEKRFGLYYGKCFTCDWLGPIAGTAYEAGQLFWQKAKKEFQLVENPILETHAKYTVNEVEAPRNTTKSAALGAPYGTQTATGSALMAGTTSNWPWTAYGMVKMIEGFSNRLDIQKQLAAEGKKVNREAVAALVNQTYQQLMESIVIQNQATQKPYWIIVSDEGHAAIPHKHFVKAEAEKEAQRLTESKPGITFTVFEAKSSVFTPKADTKKTEYAETDLVYWHKGSFYPYGNQKYF